LTEFNVQDFISRESLTVPETFVESAWLGHGPFAFHVIARLKPKVFVELGTHNGFSYFCFCQTIASKGLETAAYAVDTWQGDEHAGFYSDAVFNSVTAINQKYASFSTLMRATFSDAVDYFPDGGIDLLHIDGRHFYDDVKQDFFEWLPKLSSNAIVLFHDTNVRERDFGVWKLFKELGETYSTFEFFHQHGLGVLAIGEVPASLAAFFEAGDAAAEAYRFAYSTLGANMNRNWALQVEQSRTRELGEWRDHARELENVVRHRDAQLAEQVKLLEDAQAKLAASEEKLAASQEKRFAAETARTALTEQLELQEAQAAEAALRLQAQNDTLVQLQAQREMAVNLVVRARRRPQALLVKLLEYRVLRVLAKLSPPLPKDMTQRFARSAQKRNPKRPIMALPQSSQSPQSPQGAVVPVVPSEAPEVPVLTKPPRDCVIVVSHEATRTGAPILSLNIIRELSRKYDVISISLLGGPLARYFSEESYCSIELDRATMSPAEIEVRVMEIAQATKPLFAVANSAASYSALPALKKSGVPIVALVHEFASDLPAHPYFIETLELADKVVFSTELTLSNLLENQHICRPPKAMILAQGKSEVPSSLVDETIRKGELAAIGRAFGSNPAEITLVGIGSIHYRKGPDVFIEIARKIKQRAPATRFRFVWVGDGLDPQGAEYPRFLIDQVNRAQLQTSFHFLPSVSALDEVYAAADALIIASRLDPLPNVAIDMIDAGKPIFCFEKTTGFAEILRDEGFGACIADFFDTSDMADRIIAALTSKDAAIELGRRQSGALGPTFDMASYVAQIDAVACDLGNAVAQRQEDIDTIDASGMFRTDFYDVHARKMSQRDLIAEYVDRSKTGRAARKAVPGFHPLVYAAETGLDSTRDPLAHYIGTGTPQGIWNALVIDEHAEVDEAEAAKVSVALHIHAYYPEMLDELITRLNVGSVFPDLFISTRAGGEDAVTQGARAYKGKLVEARAFPNIGRDLGPMLSGFGDSLRQYDIVGHTHTKKSLHVQDRGVVSKWSNFMLNNLLGSEEAGPMASRTITAMARDPEIAIVYPDDPGMMSWCENAEIAEDLARRLNAGPLPDYFNFPVGSMFWMRRALFERFLGLGFDWDSYPSEPLPDDGTELHAVERLFGALPQMEKMKTAVLNVVGTTR
tara:strand:- start:18376 stop:21831 length:3456 start_codon:yes stop_codon:yes gene_type:complete